jgi:hypothetical protein
MASLIARVRSLIADPAGASQQFTDDTIQDVLDESRITVRQALLRPEVTINPGGGFVYTDYYASVGQWEDDLVLQNGSWQTVTPLTSDNLTGHWTFANTAPGQIPPLLITGKYYDTYLASAVLLERWAASWARSYDFSADGQSFRRSQAAQAMLTQAREYRKQARPQFIRLDRDDLNSDSGVSTSVIGNPDMWSY